MHNPLTAILFCNYRFSTDQMSIQSPNQQFESTICLVSTNGLTKRTGGRTSVWLTVKIKAEIIQCSANGGRDCIFIPQLVQKHAWRMISNALLIPQDHWSATTSVHAFHVQYQVLCPGILQVKVSFHVSGIWTVATLFVNIWQVFAISVIFSSRWRASAENPQSQCVLSLTSNLVYRATQRHKITQPVINSSVAAMSYKWSQDLVCNYTAHSRNVT